jgi:NitT/TauT family transport system substrate-binding protein
MNKTIRLFVLFCTVFFLIAGCTRKTPEVKEPVKIGLTVWAGTAHAYIAKEKGIFKKNNVDVELVLEKDDPTMVESYRKGKLDGILTVIPDVIVLKSEGFPTKIVYVADYSNTGDVIIADPKIRSLSDLKGKKVSFEGINSFSHIFVLQVLEQAGLKETDVLFRDVPAMDVLKELERGTIDAGHTWEPVISRAIKKGYKVLIKAGDIPFIITDILAFSTNVINERPDDVRNIVKSLLEARDYIFSNRDEALRIMAKAEGMSYEEIASGIDGIHMHNLEDNIRIMLKPEDPVSIHNASKKVSEFYLNRGQLSYMPDSSEIVEPSFIMQIHKDMKK